VAAWRNCINEDAAKDIHAATYAGRLQKRQSRQQVLSPCAELNRQPIATAKPPKAIRFQLLRPDFLFPWRKREACRARA
jgi:hypothetical protein